MIGLDLREKKRRDVTCQRRRAARTNERRHFLLCFLVVVVVFPSAPETRVCRSKTERPREQNRECSPTLRGTRREGDVDALFAPEERCAKTHGYMHACVYTHTHTERERDLRTMSFPFFLRASCVKNNVRFNLHEFCIQTPNNLHTILNLLIIKNIVVVVINLEQQQQQQHSLPS